MKIRKAAQEADQEKTADGAASVAGDGATEGGEAERAPDGAKRASMEAEDDGDGKKKKKKSAQPVRRRSRAPAFRPLQPATNLRLRTLPTAPSIVPM